MCVVIAILALMAALIIPNLVAIREGQRARAWEGDLIRLPTEARNEARKLNVPVTLRVDGNSLVMEHVQPPPPGEPFDPNADVQQVRRLDIPDGVQIAAGRQGQDTTDASTWQWTVYPDGSAQEGGLEFGMGGGAGSHHSLLLPAQASEDVRWQDGSLPDKTDDKWRAGDLAIRG